MHSTVKIQQVLEVIADRLNYQPDGELMIIPSSDFTARGLEARDVGIILLYLQRNHNALITWYQPGGFEVSEGRFAGISKDDTYHISIERGFMKYINFFNGEIDKNHIVALTADSYDPKTGVLTITPNIKVHISRSNNVNKNEQCRLMKKLFSSDRSLKNGVNGHDLLTVHKGVSLRDSQKTKIRNLRTTINKKVTEAEGPKKLIRLRKEVLYIDPTYLLKD